MKLVPDAAKFTDCILKHRRQRKKGSHMNKIIFHFNPKLYYYAVLLFIYHVYYTYALYLVVYLYRRLTEQVQPYMQPRRSGNVSP